LQLQLPAYLSVLQHLPDPKKTFGVSRLVPAGVFYVNLRGKFNSGKTRDEILSQLQESRHAAYQHSGRFDYAALPHLDNRGQSAGTQFKFRLKNDGQPYGSSTDLMASPMFAQMLAQVEENLLRMGRDIYSGVIQPNPYQKGQERACDQCEYQGICRIDPWEHKFRVLGEIP
jgi:ATP-dependent helicase/nuclease subunit B